MRTVRSAGPVLLAVLCLAGGLACSSKPPEEPVGPGPSDDLLEAAGLLRDYTIENKRGPARLSEAQKFEPLYSRAYHGIQQGNLVVVWNVPMPLEGGAAAVIAYEKQAPSEGGFVLLQNGEIKQMSPADFTSTPKAKR